MPTRRTVRDMPYNWFGMALKMRKALTSKTFLFTMAFYVAVLSLLIWGINYVALAGNCSTARVDLGYEIHEGSYNVSARCSCQLDYLG